MTDKGQATPSRRLSAPQLRTIAITVIVLAALLGTLFLWRMLRSGPAQGWQQQAVAVAAVTVHPQTVPVSLSAVGSLRAVEQVTLSPETAGRVSEILFKAGTQVKQGDLLVQLFDGPERAAREAAKAKAAFAKIQYERAQRLVPTGAQSRETLQQYKSEYEQDVAAIHQLDAQIIQKQVRAPFSGELGIRRVNLGQYLNPGDPVVTLTALDPLHVNFALPQENLARLKPGAEVSVTSDAFPGRTFMAKVNAVEPVVDEDTRNVTVQALLPNPGHVLRPGMFVTASLILPPQKGALVLPETAIQTSAEGDSVIVIRGEHPRKGGKAEIVPVQTGRRIGNNVVIASGLKPGDVVVSEGQLRVMPGAEVTVTRLGDARGR